MNISAAGDSGSGVGLDRRVLIIDDDCDFAEAMGEALGMHGYSVAFARSADSAIQSVEEFRPSALLVDLRLGHESGLDLIPEIKLRLPNAICVVVTAFPDIDTAIGAVRFRADDYLRKPVMPEEVSQILDHYLERAGTIKGADLSHPRDNVFGRLLVHRFSHLFFSQGPGGAHHDPIPRGVLPGFFAAVDMMLGAETIETSQRKCRTILGEVSRQKSLTGAAAWEAFFAESEASRIALEAEALMAVHFKDFERRAKWFSNLVLNHGPSGVGLPGGGAAGWPPSEKALMLMLSAFFSDLRAAVAAEEQRRKIEDKFGGQASLLFIRVVNEFQLRSGVN